ncbi:hypothetical protein CsSME_00049821 [Camellia sinensis var. sinensis]
MVQSFASRLNCKCQKLPLKYLGMPLGANPPRRATWKPVMEKFRKKLSGWKRMLLSFAGRVTLIKSVLSSSPVYYLSLPSSVGKEIDKIQATFLLGDSEAKKRVHLVKWKDVTMDKNLGGLRIRNLKVVNNCLLAKWWWRFGREDNSLWKQLICNKYKLEEGRWFLFMQRPPISQECGVTSSLLMNLTTTCLTIICTMLNSGLVMVKDLVSGLIIG